MVVRKVPIKKRSFDPDAQPQAAATAETPPPDPAALQEAIGLRRRLGGAENRSDEEDMALRAGYESGPEPAPAVEIIEDD